MVSVGRSVRSYVCAHLLSIRDGSPSKVWGAVCVKTPVFSNVYQTRDLLLNIDEFLLNSDHCLANIDRCLDRSLLSKRCLVKIDRCLAKVDGLPFLIDFDRCLLIIDRCLVKVAGLIDITKSRSL